MVKPERGAKSRAVREYLKEHKKAGPKEIVDALKAQGIDVTATLVSSIKYGKRGPGRRGRRKSGKGTASTHIRAYLEQNPGAKPKEIKEALAKQGLKVATGLISNVKYHFERKPSAKAGRGPSRRVDGALPSVDQLLQVKDLANSLGGLDQLRRAAEALAQLQ